MTQDLTYQAALSIAYKKIYNLDLDLWWCEQLREYGFSTDKNSGYNSDKDISEEGEG